MNHIKKQKIYTENQALPKIMAYCAYQERCQEEVREKLQSYGLSSKEVENLICRLIEENFINEERFALSFAGGKFRMKGWGTKKITEALKSKGISDYCITKALKAIEPEDYLQTLERLLRKKLESENEKHPLKRKHKVAQYAIRKGYEPEKVWSLVEKWNEL